MSAARKLLGTMAASIIALAMPVRAQEVLATGVRYFSSGGYHIVEVDLSAKGVAAHVSTPRGAAGDRLTVAGHAQADDALVAINANYFGGSSRIPCGAARGAGKQFLDSYEEAGNCVTTLAWAPGRGEIVHSAGHAKDPNFLKQYPDLVTGGGFLLYGGKPAGWNANKLENGRDCTAAGLSSDRRRLVLVVSDDRVCTGAALQRVLAAHGAADAIHLDGGGSSKMWIRGRGYVNREPEDRFLPVAIIVKAKPAAAASKCPSSGYGLYCGGAVGGDNAVLYSCDAGGRKAVKRCPWGCKSMPPGVADRCEASVGGCPPGGAGYYCGGNSVPGDRQTLYECRGGVITVAGRCPGGCKVEPAGTNDHCLPPRTLY